MEKIYMDDNSSRSRRKNKFNASVVLSFAVAIFAVVSIAVASISNVSYAVGEDLGTDFTFYEKSGSAGYNALVYASDQKLATKVSLLFADPSFTIRAYCVEHNNSNIENNVVYTKDSEITDYSLLYLLSSGENYLKSQGVTDANAITWIMQAAIWIHMYNEAGGASLSSTNPHYIENPSLFTGATALFLDTGEGELVDTPIIMGTATKTPGALVSELVTKADTATTPIDSIVLNKSDDTILQISNGDYRTPKISATASGNMESYTVSVSGIDGAYMADEEGNRLEASKVFSPSDSFYVIIPKDKVTETAQQLQIQATGKFNGLDGYYYKSGSRQKVVTVRTVPSTKSVGIEFEVVGVPDTGMTTAQTIYFIGLIVLLCGVGIVYANAKPVESKQ